MFEFILAGLLCMDTENSPAGQNYPRIMKCHESKGTQEWKIIGVVSKNTKTLSNVALQSLHQTHSQMSLLSLSIRHTL